MPSEAVIQAEIQLAVGGRPDVCIFRNSVGQMKHGGRWVRYGLCKGSADLVGIQSVEVVCPNCQSMLGTFGKFIGIEVKTPSGKVMEHQKLWMRMINNYGGNAYVARSAREAVSGLDG